VLCVPLEWLSLLLVLAELPRPSGWRESWPAGPYEGAMQLLLATYVAPLNPPASGLLALGVLLLGCAPAVLRTAFPAQSTAARLGCAAALWTVSWALQVGVGHWLLERNRPSMTTKLSLNSILLSVPLAWDWTRLPSEADFAPHGPKLAPAATRRPAAHHAWTTKPSAVASVGHDLDRPATCEPAVPASEHRPRRSRPVGTPHS
jgi:hypothetical protein